MRFSPLYSSSSGNCSVISAGKTKVLVDAGLTGKAIDSALADVGLSPSELDAILVTHEHADHIKSVGVLSRRYNLPVYANEGTWKAMADQIGGISFGNVRAFITGQDFYIGDLNVTPFPISHDAAEPVGYSFFNRGASLVYMTDTGCVTEALSERAASADLLFIEANHDVEMLKHGPYPYPLKKRILSDKGHLSNEACGALLKKLYTRGVRRAILAHLSRENNTETIAYGTVRQALVDEGIAEKDYFIAVAHRDRVTGIFEL